MKVTSYQPATDVVSVGIYVILENVLVHKEMKDFASEITSLSGVQIPPGP